MNPRLTFGGTPLTTAPSQNPPTGEKTAFEPPLLPSEPQVLFLFAKDCMPVALTDFENGANITPPELPRSCERHETDCAPHLEYLRRMWTAAYIEPGRRATIAVVGHKKDRAHTPQRWPQKPTILVRKHHKRLKKCKVFSQTLWSLLDSRFVRCFTDGPCSPHRKPSSASCQWYQSLTDHNMRSLLGTSDQKKLCSMLETWEDV